MSRIHFFIRHHLLIWDRHYEFSIIPTPFFAFDVFDDCWFVRFRIFVFIWEFCFDFRINKK